ncbi:hypothetical protein [Rhodococcus erythropolis]|uniref:hypothetical protein n=1 Tax=Rhodococcus erythropolis TaxID=1833 RepID=UPI001BE74992|nr:hypothetical protein [Rhodococcus erythropolis]MBT2264308.1 hypothetical protein [Rhodococcus erythropolis]
MRAFLVVLLSVVVVSALAAAIYFVTSRSPEVSTAHPLPDAVSTIDGQLTTCSELFGETCSFDLQTEFNTWGAGIEQFVDAGSLGPFARGIGFVASAKLSLQACGVGSAAGRTVLDFNDLARIEHPEASTTDLFPFWNSSRQFLCPTANS